MSDPKIFIVADDLGLHPTLNKGIFFALKNKLVNAVSIMPSCDAFGDAVNGLKEIPAAQVGIHLVLVEEKSLLPRQEIPSLVKTNSHFYKNHRVFFLRYLLGLINMEEVRKECEAQIKRCLETDLKLTFINSHQHLHLLPEIFEVVSTLAQKYKIPYIRLVNEPLTGPGGWFRKVQLAVLNVLSKRARSKMPSQLQANDFFIGFINAGHLGEKDIQIARQIASQNLGQLIELGCHPGFEDDDLRKKYAHWQYNWQKELTVLKTTPAAHD